MKCKPIGGLTIKKCKLFSGRHIRGRKKQKTAGQRDSWELVSIYNNLACPTFCPTLGSCREPPYSLHLVSPVENFCGTLCYKRAHLCYKTAKSAAHLAGQRQ